MIQGRRVEAVPGTARPEDAGAPHPYLLPSTFRSDTLSASDGQRVRAFEASQPAAPVQVVKAGSEGFDGSDAATRGGSVLGLRCSASAAGWQLCIAGTSV